MHKTLKNIRRTQIWRAAGKFRLLVVALVASLAGQVALTLVLPWPIKYIIDHVIRNAPNAGKITGTTTGLAHFVMSSVSSLLHSREFDFLYLGIGV